MIYKVVVILNNSKEYLSKEFIIYEGPNKQAADDAWAVTSGCGYTREYYEGIITWERTKSLLS